MEKPWHENLLNIRQIVDDAKCYQKVRDMRWPNGICYPRCSSSNNIRHGKDDMQPHRQKYLCKDCGRYFDDLTDTIFEGHHQSLSVWILCLYFMGLNLSNDQIAKELDLNRDDVHQMTSQLREGVVLRKPEVKMGGDVECDEVYVVAGHKGRRNRLKGARGRGTLEKEKPPVFGMIKRGGKVVIQMLENVKQ